MDEVAWLDDREDRAWRGLQEMRMRVDGELARRLAAESDLSYPDYVVLVALTDDDDACLRSFELGELLGWEKSRLSHHLARMEKRGLIEKRTCPSDGRGQLVRVTSAGRAEIESAAPGHLRAVRELFIDRLSNEQLDALADIAATILDR